MKNNLNVKNRFSPNFNIVKNIFLENEIMKDYIDKFFKFFNNYRALFLDVVFINSKTYLFKI